MKEKRGEILILHLLNQETIIGIVYETMDPRVISISYPRKLDYRYSEALEGYETFFLPWIPGIKDSMLSIFIANIMTMGAPIKTMLDTYVKYLNREGIDFYLIEESDDIESLEDLDKNTDDYEH
jgi:hypothetical protein